MTGIHCKRNLFRFFSGLIQLINFRIQIVFHFKFLKNFPEPKYLLGFFGRRISVLVSYFNKIQSNNCRVNNHFISYTFEILFVIYASKLEKKTFLQPKKVYFVMYVKKRTCSLLSIVIFF